MNIQIALDISINNIFYTYALKWYVWFLLHYFPTYSMFCICPAIVISSHMDKKIYVSFEEFKGKTLSLCVNVWGRKA